MVRVTLAFAFLIGIVLLQIFLSQTERKWPGLILPVISFLFGFLYPFNMSAVTLIWQVFFVWLLGNFPTIRIRDYAYICFLACCHSCVGWFYIGCNWIL